MAVLMSDENNDSHLDDDAAVKAGAWRTFKSSKSRTCRDNVGKCVALRVFLQFTCRGDVPRPRFRLVLSSCHPQLTLREGGLLFGKPQPGLWEVPATVVRGLWGERIAEPVCPVLPPLAQLFGIGEAVLLAFVFEVVEVLQASKKRAVRMSNGTSIATLHKARLGPSKMSVHSECWRG